MTLIRQYLKAIWSGRKLLVYTFLLCFGLLIYLPFLMIALKSIGKGWFGRLWLPPELTLDWYRFAVEVTNIPEIAKNTLIIAGLAVGMATLIGIPTGWAFGRRNIPGKELLMAMILLPRMIPPIAYALGVAQIFYRLHLGRIGLIGFANRLGFQRVGHFLKPPALPLSRVQPSTRCAARLDRPPGR